MSESKNSSGGGIGLLGIIFLIFLTLKLTHTGPVAEWSWWWVTAPLWGGFALLFAVVGIVLVIVALEGRTR